MKKMNDKEKMLEIFGGYIDSNNLITLVVCKKCFRRKDYIEANQERCKYRSKNHEWIEITNHLRN